METTDAGRPDRRLRFDHWRYARTPWVQPAAVLAVAALTLAACAPGAGAGSGGTSPSGAAAAVEVKSASTSVGDALTGAGGKTLYIFKQDSAGKSACNAGCATTWPPLTVPAGTQPTAASGVTGTLASITRDDGSTQVTYNGAPLYYYSKDTKAGDVIGQGVGGVWFVASPTASTSGSGAPSPSGPGTKGY